MLLFPVCIFSNLAVIFGLVALADQLTGLAGQTFVVVLLTTLVLTQILLAVLYAAIIRSWWTFLVGPVCVYLALMASVIIGMFIGFAMGGKFTVDPPGWRDQSFESRR